MSAPIIDALGWTLLHSLWQGALIAALLAVTLAAMKHFQARARYLVAGGALLVLTVCTLLTLINRLSAPGQSPAAVLAVLEQSAAWSTPLIALVSEQINVLVVLWLTGVLVFSIRFAGGYGYTQRLSHRHVRLMGDAWQSRIAHLAKQLGIQRTLSLAESALVQVPMVIGHLKPMIILPLGLLTHLSRQELEAVLLHELGHVARADYLLNMVQSLVEVLFFFHPAVWWMTGRMRAEREHCCDDLAIAVTRDPVTFAKALARLAELELAGKSPNLAMAASGNGSLIFRIRRLVERDRLPGFTERLASALLVLCGLLTVGFLSAGPQNSRPNQTNAMEAIAMQEMLQERELLEERGLLEDRTQLELATKLHQALEAEFLAQEQSAGANAEAQHLLDMVEKLRTAEARLTDKLAAMEDQKHRLEMETMRFREEADIMTIRKAEQQRARLAREQQRVQFAKEQQEVLELLRLKQREVAARKR